MTLKKIIAPSQSIIQAKMQTLDMVKIRSEAKNKVLKDSYISQLIQDYKFSDQVIDSHLGLLLKIYDDVQPCHNCQHFASCPKPLKGLQAGLDFSNNDLILVYRACAYRQEYDKYANNYLYHDFPDEWMSSTIDSLKINNQRREYVRSISEILEGKLKGLYVHGKLGLGKSYMAVTLCNEFINIQSEKVAYVNARKIVETLRNVVYDKESNEYETTKQALKSVPLLVLDDIGSERITDWSKEEIIYNLLEARIQSGLITIFTSDFSLNELKELYGKNDLKNRRLFDLLINYVKEIELQGVRVK